MIVIFNTYWLTAVTKYVILNSDWLKGVIYSIYLNLIPLKPNSGWLINIPAEKFSKLD